MDSTNGLHQPAANHHVCEYHTHLNNIFGRDTEVSHCLREYKQWHLRPMHGSQLLVAFSTQLIKANVDMQSTAMTDSVDSPAAEVAVKATWSSMSTAPGLTPSSA